MDEEIEKLRIAEMFRNQKSSAIGSVIVSSMALYIYSRPLDLISMGWAGSIIFLCLFRLFFVYLFEKSRIQQSLNYVQIENAYAALMVSIGFFWGLTFWIFVPLATTSSEKFLILLMPMGVLAGAVAGLSESKKTSNGFNLAVTVPTAISFWSIGEGKSSIIGFAVFIYVGLLWKISKTGYERFVELTKISLENVKYAGYLKQKLQLEQELKSHQEQSIRSAHLAAMGQMTGGIAHEINNPLSVIIGATEMISMKLQNEGSDLQESLKIPLELIIETSARISKIIKSVGMLTRDQNNIKKEEKKIRELINQVLVLVDVPLKEQGIDFRAKGDLSAVLYADQIQISQVLINLINNSMYQLQNEVEEKWISLTVFEGDDYLEMKFSDSGGGIDPKIASKIVNPFYTTKPSGEGTGLGLSLSQSIIEKHEGTMELGDLAVAEFIVRLPNKKCLEKVLAIPA